MHTEKSEFLTRVAANAFSASGASWESCLRHLKHQRGEGGGRSGKAIMVAVIQQQMNISAISHDDDDAVNSPDGGARSGRCG